MCIYIPKICAYFNGRDMKTHKNPFYRKPRRPRYYDFI